MCDKRQLTHPHMALNYLEPKQNLNQKKKKRENWYCINSSFIQTRYVTDIKSLHIYDLTLKHG